MADTFDIVGAILSFEMGDLDESEIIELGQQLYDSGLWLQLQGSYGRMVQSMIDQGLIST